MYKGEDKILEAVQASGSLSLEEVAGKTGMNIDSVRRAVESLKAGDYISLETSDEKSFSVTDEFQKYLASGEMPEYSVYKKAQEGKAISELSETEKSIGLRWAKIKGFISIDNGLLKPLKSNADAVKTNQSFLDAAQSLKQNQQLEDSVMGELLQRKLVRSTVRRLMVLKPTGKKYALESAGFDVSVASADVMVGKNHPVTRLKKKISTIMSELGFQEMEGSIVESSFWNFDALFQPQDHPARELADTFYLKGKCPLPKDKALVNRVKNAHESGWKYSWSEELAQKQVLRTHTTALSARYLASLKGNKTGKFFAVGKVFRNEATDFKHLAEFYQVEGIVVWKDATFCDLLGILKEFYRKLGFEKIRFRPSFFPYTEPSLEIEVFFEPRQQWLELGGAGIFRPEVCEPLAQTYPVLAWGLSLERPLMLALGLEDIRTFYRNDADFLKDTRMRSL